MFATFFRQAATLAGGSGLAQAIALLATPLISRMYQPEHFGILALFMGILAPIAVVSGGRYEMALMLPKSELAAKNLFALSLALVGLASLASLLLVAGVKLFMPSLSVLPRLGTLIFLVPVGVLAVGATNVMSAWAVRIGSMRDVALSKVVASFGTAASQLAIGAVRVAPAGLIAGTLIGQTATVMQLASKLLHPRSYALRGVTFGGMVFQARVHGNFPRYNAIQVLIDNLQSSAVVFLVLAAFGPVAVGLYSMTIRLMRAPMALLGGAIGQVFFREAAKIHPDDGAVRFYSRRLLIRLAALMALPMAVVLVFGPDVVEIVLGSAWREAGVFARLLVPYFYFHFLASPMSALPLIYGRQATTLAYTVTGNVLYVLGISIGALMSDLSTGLLIASLLMAGYFLVFVRWSLALTRSGRKRDLPPH